MSTEVYIIPAKNNNTGNEEIYIRSTKRNLKQEAMSYLCFLEYKWKIANGNLGTMLPQRFYETDLSINWRYAYIINHVTNTEDLKLARSLQNI